MLENTEVTMGGMFCITVIIVSIILSNSCTEAIYIMNMNMDDCDKPATTYYNTPPKKESK